MNASPIRQPTAVIPIAMSLAAMATIVYHVAVHGTAPQPDEGAAAHLWQLLMAGQLPVVAFYAITWLPRAPRTALAVLAVQAGAIVAAAAPIFLMGW
jgi:hypothetical protein